MASSTPTLGMLYPLGDHLSFGINPDGGAVELTVLDNGDIGIGTETPVHALHVSRTGDAVLRLEADTDDSGEGDNPRVEFFTRTIHRPEVTWESEVASSDR